MPDYFAPFRVFMYKLLFFLQMEIKYKTILYFIPFYLTMWQCTLELIPMYTLVYPVPIFLVGGLGELGHTWRCSGATHDGAWGIIKCGAQKWNGNNLTPVLTVQWLFPVLRLCRTTFHHKSASQSQITRCKQWLFPNFQSEIITIEKMINKIFL